MATVSWWMWHQNLQYICLGMENYLCLIIECTKAEETVSGAELWHCRVFLILSIFTLCRIKNRYWLESDTSTGRSHQREQQLAFFSPVLKIKLYIICFFRFISNWLSQFDSALPRPLSLLQVVSAVSALYFHVSLNHLSKSNLAARQHITFFIVKLV